MRILEVCYNDPESHCGGVEDFVLNLIVQMSKKGHKVTCIFSDRTLPNSTGVDYKKVNIFSIRNPREAVLSQLHKIAYNFAVLLYVVKNRNDFDVFHINGDNGVFLAPFFGRKAISTFFGMPIFKLWNTYKNTRSMKNFPRLMIALMGTMIHFPSLLFSKFVVADNPQITRFLRNFRNFNDVKLIYNCVDTEIFKTITPDQKIKLRKELNLDTSKKYAIWIGNDAKGYGQDVAFSIALNHKVDFTLLSVGSPSEINGDNIIQLGRLDHETLAKYIRSSDFMIFPQRYPGISLSMVSAMISGLKVVTFSKYMSDFFTVDNAIFAKTPEEMDKIVTEILRNPSLLDTSGKRSDPILLEFCPDNCAQKYLNLYEGL